MQELDPMERLRELAAAEARDAGADAQVVGSPLEDAHEQLRHLLVALDQRTVTGQATGIVMERYGLSAEVAFGVLVRLSQEQNLKLYEIARRLTETGDAPGLRRPS